MSEKIVMGTPQYMDVFPEEFKPDYPVPVYEMADDLKHYKVRLLGMGSEIYHHVIYILVLGNKLPYVEHWKKELMTFAIPVFKPTLKKGTANINRGKYVQQQMMAPYMGINFEDYDVSHIKNALQNEINKGNYELRKGVDKIKEKSIQRSMKIIQNIMDYLDDNIAKKCLEPLTKFYANFLVAAEQNNSYLYKQAVDELEPLDL